MKPSKPQCWTEGQILEGNDVTMSCKSTEGSDPIRYNWERVVDEEKYVGKLPSLAKKGELCCWNQIFDTSMNFSPMRQTDAICIEIRWKFTPLTLDCVSHKVCLLICMNRCPLHSKMLSERAHIQLCLIPFLGEPSLQRNWTFSFGRFMRHSSHMVM